MAARPQLHSVRTYLWKRSASLRVGVKTGVFLSAVFVVWLLVANRVPEIESFAGVRNIAAGAVTFMLMLIPVLRFLRDPVKMFVSGLTAWTLLTLAYMAMEMRFSLLESRMGALHIFMLGGVSYGFVSVFHWVFLLCAEARHRHVAQAEQVAIAAVTPHIH